MHRILNSWQYMLIITILSVAVPIIAMYHNNSPNDYKTQSFKILAVSDHNTAVVRWIDGTLTTFNLGGVPVDKDVVDLKGSKIVVKYSQSYKGEYDVLEVKK